VKEVLMSGGDRSREQVPVAIVGAGPVGLALALGLARAGVRTILVDRGSSTSSTSRAPGVHVRTREILRQWEVEPEFLARGSLLRELTLHRADRPGSSLYTLGFSPLEREAEDPGLLLLEQSETEGILLEAVRASGMCEVRFECEAIGVRVDEHRVVIEVRENQATREIVAEYLAGCDGAGSFVRAAAGLSFDGDTYSVRPVLADVAVAGDADRLPWPRAWNGKHHFSFAARLPGGLWRLVSIRRREPESDAVEEGEVRDLAHGLLGTREVEVRWASRFRIHLRSAPRFRAGRVLLAGDAAHIHSPAMGFGMNAGIQDAHDLAWKLAAALRGGDRDRLLDAYDVERRAVVVETVSRSADLVTRLFLDAPAALRTAAALLLRQALRVPPVRRANLRRVAMLDLPYPPSPLLREGDAAAGERLPDPRVTTPDGSTRRLHRVLPAGAALLALGEAAADTPSSVGDEVDAVLRFGPGEYDDSDGVLEALAGFASGWILVRPDRHVAWARRSPDGMEAAIRYALGR
jgi:2-polyprenyl-6-methoxyphenol hydroxylase-like FAD-dependent oxidoreductase